jgi:hypothetical protein
LDYCATHAKSGQTKIIYDLVKRDKYDILIMGSSQANHHYVPQIIADSFNKSVYNAGMDGNGIVLMNGIYKMIAERYEPELIIYNVTPSFDFLQYSRDDNNKRYITTLKPFYDNEQIKKIINKVDPLECLKMQSRMYRYNTVCINTMKNAFITESSINNLGFEPLYGVMDYEPVLSDDKEACDSLKLIFLEDFIKTVSESHTKLIVASSPKYGAESSAAFDIVRDLCKKYNVKYFDNYTDAFFINNKSYYEDPMHLNNTGAELYTQRIIDQIKNN